MARTQWEDGEAVRMRAHQVSGPYVPKRRFITCTCGCIVDEETWSAHIGKPKHRNAVMPHSLSPDPLMPLSAVG